MKNNETKINRKSTLVILQWPMVLAIVFLFSGIAVSAPYYGRPTRTEGKGRVLYSPSFTIHGRAAQAGDEVGAFDSAGVCRGRFTVKEAGVFGFMPVYGANGEVINFRVVSKAAKREYLIQGIYTIDGATGQFDSVPLTLVTGGEYDSDEDGMCDYWEWSYGAHGFDPDSWNDPGEDTDGDGWVDILEYAAGTSPGDAESNPHTILVNYGPEGSVPEGYLEDSGQTGSGKGYGWQ